MKSKLFAFVLIALLVVSSAFAQRRPRPAAPPAEKTTAARLIVKGTYEEIFEGITDNGPATGKLTINFEIGRWLKQTTNEVGNAEFSDLPGGQPPSVSGVVSYQGQVKLATENSRYDALSNFSGALADNDVSVTNPEYNDTGTGYKIRVFINPKLKGKCSMVSVRGGETRTSSDCQNGTYFFTASNPLEFDDNEDPAKTAETASLASFGVELDVEPAMGEPGNTGSGVDEAARARKELEKAMGPAAGGSETDGGYVWRGAVTNGSKETGFKILLHQQKDQPSDDKRSRAIRHLVFEATITPGIPK